jgi:peptidoglycan/LPS O-acetylase OafA/YrhL
MRAIAVGLVILGHAGFSAVPGGFIGVDVFFVISGYLITSIIFAKLQTDSFSFLGFYERRVKRLMPVLFVVIAATLIASSFVLLPKDLEKLSMSVVFVTLFVGNFFFWREYGGYFADDSQTAGLLHTWSLAVEEQYYFVWPVTLLLMLRMVGPVWTGRLCLAGMIPAVLFSQYGTEQTIGAAYYLLPTRFFELLAGSALALYPTLISRPRPAALNHALALVGLALLLWSAVTLTAASAFPGYNALPVVIGTLCLLAAPGSGVSAVLATRPVVYVGKLSYSLYLWHWPVLSLMHYAQIAQTGTNAALAIALTFVLSATGYHLVENPLRTRRYGSQRVVFIALYGLPAAVLIGISFAVVSLQGLPARFSPDVVAMDAAVHDVVHEQRAHCHASARQSQTAPSAECLFGAEQTPASVFIFGDSHANHMVPFVGVLAQNAGRAGQDYTMDRCPPLIGLRYGASAALAARCEARNAAAAAHIGNGGFDYVVLAASWPNPRSSRLYNDTGLIADPDAVESALVAALEHTLQRISEAGAQPVLIRETPILQNTSPKCPIHRQRFDQNMHCAGVLQISPFMEKWLPTIQQRWPSLRVLDPASLICDDAQCVIMLESTPLFSDDNHFNVRGSRVLGEAYLRAEGNPFNPPTVPSARQDTP